MNPVAQAGEGTVGVPPEGQAFLLARALKALDDDDLERAAALLEGLLAKGYPEYNPDQARVPAGDPSGLGGQWSAGGGLGADLSGGGSDDSSSGGAGGSTDRSDGDDEYSIVPLANQSASPRPELLSLVDFDDTKDHSTTRQGRAGQFAAAVDRMPGLTDTEKTSFMTTFVLEGDSRYGGITPGTLRYYRWKHPDAGLPAKRKDLDDTSMAQFYKVHIDETLGPIGGGGRLADIKDPTAAAAMFDVLSQDGGQGGTRSIQTAVNAVLVKNPDIDRSALGLDGPLTVNGAMGATTFDAYVGLANDPKHRDELLKALAEARNSYRQEHYPKNRTDWRGSYLGERRTP